MGSFLTYFMENFAKRDYSCLMLDCSDLSVEIEKIQKKIRKSDIYTEGTGHGLEKDSHITILYGLLTNSAKRVLKMVDDKPIEYKIKGISLFENEKFDVLKFDIESDDLKKLNKKISKAFPNENKFPDYHAHMTIGYIKPGRGKKYIDLESPIIGATFLGSVLDFSDKQGKHTHRLLEG